MDQAGNMAKKPDVKQAVVRRAIIAREPPTIHAQAHRQALQCHVMNDHVVGTLHEGRINGQKRAKSFGSETTGKQCGVFLGDADVEVAVWKFLFEDFQLCSAGHRGGDSDDLRIFFCKIRDRATKEIRTSRAGG